MPAECPINPVFTLRLAVGLETISFCSLCNQELHDEAGATIEQLACTVTGIAIC